MTVKLFYMKKFRDKVVIITGGASGIGKASSLKFAKEGATVIIWDINQGKCEETHGELIAKGFKSAYYLVDTTDPAAVDRTAQLTIKKYRKVDVLINNAGITRDATIKKMTFQEWQQVINVNLTGVFNCTKAISAFMIENKSGTIINTSSVVGIYGNFGQTNYAATKSGLIGMTKTLAKELGKYSITVNAVAPGFIATEMIATMPEKVIDMMKGRTALKRLGTPEDIANAYAFLASDDASFISGAVLSVDGAVSI